MADQHRRQLCAVIRPADYQSSSPVIPPARIYVCLQDVGVPCAAGDLLRVWRLGVCREKTGDDTAKLFITGTTAATPTLQRPTSSTQSWPRRRPGNITKRCHVAGCGVWRVGYGKACGAEDIYWDSVYVEWCSRIFPHMPLRNRLTQRHQQRFSLTMNDMTTAAIMMPQ